MKKVSPSCCRADSAHRPQSLVVRVRRKWSLTTPTAPCRCRRRDRWTALRGHSCCPPPCPARRTHGKRDTGENRDPSRRGVGHEIRHPGVGGCRGSGRNAWSRSASRAQVQPVAAGFQPAEANRQATNLPPQQAPAYFPADLPGTPYPLPVPFQGQPPPYALPPVEPVRIPEHISNDPLLDRPFAPQPGWYFYSETYITGVHLTNQLSGGVTTPAGRTDVVAPAGSPLDVSVAPRTQGGLPHPQRLRRDRRGLPLADDVGSGNTIGDFGPAAARRHSISTSSTSTTTRSFSLGWFPATSGTSAGPSAPRPQPLLRQSAELHQRRRRPGRRGHHSGRYQQPQRLRRPRRPRPAPQAGRPAAGPGLRRSGRLDRRVWPRSSALLGSRSPMGPATSSSSRFETSPMAFEGQFGDELHRPELEPRLFFAGYETQYWWQIGRLSNQLRQSPTSARPSTRARPRNSRASSSAPRSTSEPPQPHASKVPRRPLAGAAGWSALPRWRSCPRQESRNDCSRGRRTPILIISVVFWR